jgi:hypothetical protein
VTDSIEPELITIVEGPTPEFHMAQDTWTLSILEGQGAYVPATCQVRSFNGQKLIDRCLNAWSTNRPIRLDYRQVDGLRKQVDIIGARLDKVDGVDVLNLWIRQPVNRLIRFGNDNNPLPGAE